MLGPGFARWHGWVTGETGLPGLGVAAVLGGYGGAETIRKRLKLPLFPQPLERWTGACGGHTAFFTSMSSGSESYTVRLYINFEI